MSTKWSTYNADTKEGEVFSRHAVDLDSVPFKNLDILEFGEMARRIQDIEDAAYERGRTDLAAKIRLQLVV